MPSIYELINAKEVAKRWNQKARERKPFLGEMLFPVKKQLGTSLEYIKGAHGSIKPLMLSAYDAKAIPVGREAFSKLTAELPFFKNSKNVNEKMRQNLNNLISGGNKQVIDIVVNDIFDDKSNLLTNADITREMMRMQALTTGSVAFSSNGQSLSFDYQVPNSNKVTPKVKWDVYATADPISDIIDWKQLVVEATGDNVSAMVLNSTTLKHIGKCESVKNAVYVFGDGKVTVNTARVKEYILQETGLTTYVYDKGYKNDSNAFVKFVADGTVAMFPDGALGNTVFGTTPEESDLLSGSDAKVEIVDTGVAVTTIKEKDPVNVMTKVSMVCLPSMEKADSLIIASVLS